MILLDTNIVSALMHEPVDSGVGDWLDRQPRTSIWTTSVTIFELHFGIEIMALGRRRAALTQAFISLIDKLDGRIAVLDREAAERAAELMAVGRKQGRPRDLRDTVIAGIALARHAALATRNTAHFEHSGIALINPWID
jgi:toxin FitB